MILRNELVQFLDELLQPANFEDTTFNGLQIEGNEKVSKVGFSVDSSMDVFETAFRLNCDFLIVHHGLIWGGLKNINSINRKRLKFLLENDINLYVSHLPLDFHPEIGNNVSILKELGFEKIEVLEKLGAVGNIINSIDTIELLEITKQKINPLAYSLSFYSKPQNKLFVSTGAVSRNLIEKIFNMGIKTLLTGEAMGESTFYYILKEFEMNIIFAGHYQTEIFGLLSLNKLMENKFSNKLQYAFIDLPH